MPALTTGSLGKRVRLRTLACGALLPATVGLGACGGFDSKASGEQLIKRYVKKFGASSVTLKSVSCPSGVAQKVGHTYDCRVVLHTSANDRDVPGSITIHMVSGNKVEITGRQDLHFP